VPTTSKGLRYPASSAAPNVPQDIQNLASDIDTRFTRFNQFSVGWNATTIAGLNNITTNSITVPAQSGPYLLVAHVGVLSTMNGTTIPTLQLLVNGAIKAQQLFTGITTTNSNHSRELSRSIYVSDGSSRTVQGRIDIPSGATVTTYTDDTHSYVSVFTIPMW